MICLIFLLLFKYSSELNCPKNDPFILVDQSCGSFYSACYKTDENCKALQQACEQCPPSKDSFSLLTNIFNNSQYNRNDRMILNYSLNHIKDDLKFNKKTNDTILILIIVLFILVFILYLEIISKIIRKFLRHYFICNNGKRENNNSTKKMNKENENYLGKNDSVKIQEEYQKNQIFDEKGKYLQCLKSRKYDILQQIYNQLTGSQNIVEPENSCQPEITSIERKFEIEGMSINLHIYPNDNIVIIKRQICAKWVNSKQDCYKIMEIHFNGHRLDDNELLFPHIKNKPSNLKCIVKIPKKEPSKIVVLRIIGKNQQMLIQIDKDKFLKKLETDIISHNNHDKKIFFPSQSQNKLSLIDISNQDHSIESCGLKDYDCINIIIEDTYSLEFKSITSEGINIKKIKCKNTGQISFLKSKISENLNCKVDNIILFLDNFCLDGNKFIFEYQISGNRTLSFCRFLNCKESEFDIIKKYEVNENYEIFIGKYKNNEEMMIKKYAKLSPNLDNEFSPNLENELITFHKTIDSDNVIKLKKAFESDKFYYICVRYMPSLEQKLNEEDGSISEIELVKWTRDILNALNYFHDYNISHPNLTISKILISKKGAKISLFGSIENNPAYNNRTKFGEQLNYNDKCNNVEDVKNIGNILLNITKRNKNSTGNNAEVETNPLLSNDIDQLDISKDLKEFITKCLEADNNQRPTVKQLLQMNFLKCCKL